MGWISVALLDHPAYQKLAEDEQHLCLVLAIICAEFGPVTGPQLVPRLAHDLATIRRGTGQRLARLLAKLCTAGLATSETRDSITYYRAKPPDDFVCKSQRHSAQISGREGGGGEMGSSESSPIRRKSRRDSDAVPSSLPSPNGKSEATSSSQSRARKSGFAGQILLWWNGPVHEKLGVPPIRFVSLEREKKWLARLKEVPDLMGVIEGEGMEVGSWAREKGFITFDWLMNPKNLTKFLEGNYREKTQTSDRDADMDFIRERYGNAESV